MFRTILIFTTLLQSLLLSFSLIAAPPTAQDYIVVFKVDANHKRQPLKRMVRALSSKQLKALQTDPTIKYIEPNRTISLPSFTTQKASVNSWGLDRLDQTTLPLNGFYSPIGDGSGVHAYIIDTGIRTSHNEFSGRAQWDFTAADINDGNDDGNGHGTHMAGIVGGLTYGVASAVNLHGVKVLNNHGQGSLAGLIAGIEYVTNNHQSPAVAVIGVSTGYSQALNDAITAATNAGVTVVSPAGDEVRDGCDYSPGLHIKSAWHLGDHYNNTLSHSPVAAAHVAGAAALVRGNDPSCNVTQVKNKLLTHTHNGVLVNVPTNTANQ